MALGIQEAGIAGVVPAVRRQHFGSGLGILVVLLEQPGRAHQDLAVLGDLDLDPADGDAHRVGLGLIVGLQADEHRGFGGAVQLFEVDADGTVEREQIRPDRLTGGVGHTHSGKTQVVAQRPIHEQVAQEVGQPIDRANRLLVHQRGAHALGHIHEAIEHPALDPAGVLHPDHHGCEHGFEYPGRREVIGRPDLFQVDHHGGRRLGAIDHIAAGQPLRIAEDVLTDPRGRQVGQHLLPVSELVEQGARVSAVQQTAVRVHHPLGVAGGARREKHRGDVIGPGLLDRTSEERGLLRGKVLARLQQNIE